MTYEINTQDAISETLDGETIVINLKSGNYYSLNETGTLVWTYIVEKYSTESMAATLASHYGADTSTVEKAIADFIETLQKDSLIQETTQTNNSPIPSPTTEKKLFVAPKIEKYEDMQEMIMADPVHDVDEMGWPNLKK